MKRKPKVLVSACLLGIACRYDGGAKSVASLEALLERAELIPFCPEQLGGLPTPRMPSERRGARVFNREGADVTDAFERGSVQALKLAQLFGAEYALLKARSPSCGNLEIYDGTFSGRTIPGQGVAATALEEAGLALFNETQLDALYDALKGTDR